MKRKEKKPVGTLTLEIATALLCSMQCPIYNTCDQVGINPQEQGSFCLAKTIVKAFDEKDERTK